MAVLSKNPLLFRGRAGRERKVTAALARLEKALRRKRVSPRDTFPLRAQLARTLAEAATPPGGYRGGEGGEFAGAVFPDGGADVFLPAELLDGFYAAGFPLPPGAEVGDLLHVLCHSWEGAVLRIGLLAEALRTFAEVHVWVPGPEGRYSPRSVRPLLRDARGDLLACLEISGGARGGGEKVVRLDDWAFRRWAGQFLETVDQVL
ncbi:hypothetical protein [Desulfovirgula thermocuniculi]|uniref:hypothetical protein n=1 Tax=Desulfovirgula thermocuniculi TaxID=348842 RepID=UPI000420C916|nr:hypothetical protein [Desulfovirgula thermocuniculi]